MRISKTLRKHAKAVQDAQNSYQQDVFNISTVMTSVIATYLPLPNYLPNNWTEVQTAYKQARTDAYQWTNVVYAQLQSTPPSVENYNEIMIALFQDAIDQSSTLITNPNNASAKNLLNADLKNIKKTLNLVNIFITGCQNAFTDFGLTVLPDAARQLTTVCNDAYEDKNIDQAAIDDLKKQIDELNQEIIELGVEIGINSAAITAELTVGVVLFAELGPADLILIGIAVAGSGTVIALDALKLEKDQVELSKKHQQLDLYSQDAAALQTTGDTYQQLSDQTVALSASVDGISSAWKAVEDDMTAAIDDVTAATAEVGTDYQAVYDDLVDALNYWNEVYSDCVNLEININGNTGNFAIGQSSQDVSDQINANTSVDYVTYINNFPLSPSTI